jgi:phage gpG-like protein
MPEEQLYIENLDELLNILARRAPAEFHRTAVGAMTGASAQVTNWARMNSPVDTGRLRSSIRFEVKPTFGNVQGVIGSNVVYAPFVEFGGGKPRGVGRIPYLRPAVEEHQSQIKRIFERAFQAVARRLGF